MGRGKDFVGHQQHTSFNVLQNSQDEGGSITDDSDHEVVLQIHNYLLFYLLLYYYILL